MIEIPERGQVCLWPRKRCNVGQQGLWKRRRVPTGGPLCLQLDAVLLWQGRQGDGPPLPCNQRPGPRRGGSANCSGRGYPARRARWWQRLRREHQFWWRCFEFRQQSRRCWRARAHLSTSCGSGEGKTSTLAVCPRRHPRRPRQEGRGGIAWSISAVSGQSPRTDWQCRTSAARSWRTKGEGCS